MIGDGGPWLIWACALVVGCSSGNDGTSFSPGAGGLGGTSTNGGATSASGGTAGLSGGTSGGGVSDAASDQSPRGVCRAYIDAVCRRRAVCNGRSPDEMCVGYAADIPCPDYFFSPGSTRTAAQMQDCAKQVATLSCGIALQGTPPCSTPGTRAPGEKCLYGSQCSTLGCSVSFRGSLCGTCLPFLAPGAPCNVLDGICPVDLVCYNGSCQKAPDLAPVTVPGPGMPCTASCVTGYACSSGKTCAPLPPAGQPCSALGSCTADAYCTTGSVCAARPGPGAPCALDLNNNPQCASNARCVAGATDGSHFCVASRETGESCTDPNDACAPGTACTGGKCVTTGASPGVYDQVCGP